jgi:hypothetical protein
MASHSEIYQKAAELISPRDSFSAHHTAQHPNDQPDKGPLGCLATHPKAQWFNAGGAIIRAGGGWPKAKPTWLAFRDRVCPDGGSLYSWSIWHTHEQQVEALRLAAEAA